MRTSPSRARRASSRRRGPARSTMRPAGRAGRRRPPRRRRSPVPQPGRRGIGRATPSDRRPRVRRPRRRGPSRRRRRRSPPGGPLFGAASQESTAAASPPSAERSGRASQAVFLDFDPAFVALAPGQQQPSSCAPPRGGPPGRRPRHPFRPGRRRRSRAAILAGTAASPMRGRRRARPHPASRRTPLSGTRALAEITVAGSAPGAGDAVLRARGARRLGARSGRGRGPMRAPTVHARRREASPSSSSRSWRP